MTRTIKTKRAVSPRWSIDNVYANGLHARDINRNFAQHTVPNDEHMERCGRSALRQRINRRMGFVMSARTCTTGLLCVARMMYNNKSARLISNPRDERWAANQPLTYF